MSNTNFDPSSNPLRLFILEDSPAILDLVIQNLTEIPGLVLAGIAETEYEALQKLSLLEYDVLIADIELGQGNGMNLLRALAKLPEHSSSIKIIFSNHVSDFYRRAGEEYGVQYFFDKSSDFWQMKILLEKLVERRHLH